jgi:predicted AAA+ superfamily ATPase
MKIDWKNTAAAVWRAQKSFLRPVKSIDPVSLDSLIGVDGQKLQLVRNTERFLSDQPFNNALLWGARGTGKSSLIKAILNEYRDRDLRLIEVFKNDLRDLPDIVDVIRDLEYRFIIYCDDFSFDEGDTAYIVLKTVLEGSIEAAPDNVVLYATSNRRHLMPEYMKDNLESGMVDGELHYADAVEEKISLSDRFGLWLSFYQPDQDGYLAIVNSYFADFQGDRAGLYEEAIRFAMRRASRSGRTAKQFFNAWSASK